MASIFGRRKFLTTAGATAAGSIVLAAGQTAAHAAPTDDPPPPSPDPELVFVPIIGVVFLDETKQFGLSDFHAVGSGYHVVLASGTSPGIFTDGGGALILTIDVEPDATLDSVTVHAKGTGTLTAEIWQQNFSSTSTFTGNAPVGSATGTANATTITPALSTGTASGANSQFQLRITGTTPSYTVSHATANYKSAAATGFHPVGPARVYDSRDPGSGGPLTGGQTRNVSIANATAFSGGTANIVPEGARTITYNLTATDCVSAGFLAIYPKGGSLKASALNWTAGEDVANGGVVNVSSDRMVTIEAGGGGNCNFIIDITGYYN